MATYVNDLRLKEITTGDESGTWGTSTNTNLELIAEAFSYGTEVITTNADTHTTTIADGATDPGRSLYLKYTGTLDSACTITIGPNTVSKVWIVENGTSGSQDIILSQGSGANITIPAGDTKVVYSDGAGAGAAFVDAFASLSVVDLKVQDDLTVTDDASIGGDATITGTLGVTGDITGTLATAAQPNITSVGTLTGFTSTGIDDNADATAITIDSSENVGIGTTSPAGKLTVYGGEVQWGASSSLGSLSYTGGFPVIGAIGALPIAFYTNGNERMRIDSSGNVGIGASSPQAKLHLLDTDDVYLQWTDSGNIAGRIGVNGSYMHFGLDGADGETERMRIDSSGNLLVGTTSSAQDANNGTKILAGGNVSVVNSGANDGFDYYNSSVGAYRFYVQASGQIAATFTSISAISDIRFKENVRDLDVGLNAIMSLKPRLYDWKEGKGANIKNARGFIAQEFEEVFPDLIDEWKDPAPEGEEPYKSVRQDLIPVLVKAIQEQQALIESLTARITTLEG
jgi:hypothetical protein